jgi:hypothetical protein
MDFPMFFGLTDAVHKVMPTSPPAEAAADSTLSACPRYHAHGGKGGAMDRHASGILLIVLSAIAYSSAGFFTRLVLLDAWTMLFWRGLFPALMILCVIVAQKCGNTGAAIRAVGSRG